MINELDAQCATCNKIKRKTLFQKIGRTGILSPICKKCYNAETAREKRRTKAGMATYIYQGQAGVSIARGHDKPAYTRDELYVWLLSQPKFHTLFEAWIKSGMNTDLKPSVDRRIDELGYSFDNIRLMTWYENRRQQRPGYRKKIIQMDIVTGEILNGFDNLYDARLVSGEEIENIVKMCYGELEPTVYAWKFIKRHEWEKLMDELLLTE